MDTTPDITSVPRGWVALAAVVLALAAGVGGYLGVMRSLGAHDLPSDSDTLTPAPNVTNAKPLADSAADDAHIRSIAREEAVAALKSAAPKPKPVAPKADDDASDDPAAALNAAASGKPSSTTSDGVTTKPALSASRPARTAAPAYPYTPAASSTPN